MSRGIPPKEIDWIKVEDLLIHGSTGSQIAAILGIHPDTLYSRCEQDKGTNFSAYAQDKRSIGDSQLHKTQFHVAVKEKNTTMLIHLGKHRLGQKDREEKGDEKPKESEDTTKQLYIALDELAKLRKEMDELRKERTLNAPESQASSELHASDPQH